MGWRRARSWYWKSMNHLLVLSCASGPAWASSLIYHFHLMIDYCLCAHPALWLGSSPSSWWKLRLRVRISVLLSLYKLFLKRRIVICRRGMDLLQNTEFYIWFSNCCLWKTSGSLLFTTSKYQVPLGLLGHKEKLLAFQPTLALALPTKLAAL